MNDLQRYANVFADIVPWGGKVPAGCVVDFLGIVTPKEFFEPWGAHPAYVDGVELQLPLPRIGTGRGGDDFWFESVNWLLAARDARDRFVMMTLGALHGYQAVGACRVLQRVNPMPYKLVAVEPIPDNVRRIFRLMRDNDIDPEQQWIIQAVMSDTNEPAFFPVGAPGAGSQNCFSTNNESARDDYLKQFISEGRVEEALRNILLHNSTGLQHDIAAAKGLTAEVKLVSCLTLRDLLSPFERVDYVEADMQESEIRVFPPFIDLLRRKARRVHIATHGHRVHVDLLELFTSKGWEIVFSYAPDAMHATPFGDFKTNDGVLTVLNPDL
jgi:hypothetical protein